MASGEVGDCGAGRIAFADGLEGEAGLEPEASRNTETTPKLTVVRGGRTCEGANMRFGR